MSKSLPSVAETSPQDFYINKGLYESFYYSQDEISEVQNGYMNEVTSIVYCRDSIDSHCVGCEKHSIFTPVQSRGFPSPFVNSEPSIISRGLTGQATHQIEFICSRNANHVLTFNLLLKQGVLTKIGQFPSYADITLRDVDKYKGLLPNDLFIEFKKGIGLYTHGIGAGSLVYLRRIIEKFMITPAYEKAKAGQSDWDDENYSKLRVGEKIKLLKDYLPQYLVANTVIYGIVSRGIHELSEQECVQYFPVLRSFIEVILTDMKNKKDEENTKKQLADGLQSIVKNIK